MCAELRYMLELLAPVYSKAKEYKKALQHMVKCQSLLGDLQVRARRLAAVVLTQGGQEEVGDLVWSSKRLWKIGV